MDVWLAGGDTVRYAIVLHHSGKFIAIDLRDFEHHIGSSTPTKYRVYDTFEQALIVTMSRGV